jgi:hypothetical protein
MIRVQVAEAEPARGAIVPCFQRGSDQMGRGTDCWHCAAPLTNGTFVPQSELGLSPGAHGRT